MGKLVEITLKWLLLTTMVINSEVMRRRESEIGELVPNQVSQSSTLGYNDAEFGASYAIDGDLSTQSATRADVGDQYTWFKLQFDKSYPINTVVYYYKFFTNWFDPSQMCVGSKGYFEWCVSSDTGIDVSVYLGDKLQKFCGLIELTKGLEQSDQIYRVDCAGAEGDNVRLEKNGGIPVYEIAVISDAPSCDKPTVEDGALDPVPDAETVESGSTYQVSCNSGFTLSGSPTITCTEGKLSTLPTCQPSEDEDKDPNECDPTSGDCFDHSGSLRLFQTWSPITLGPLLVSTLLLW